MIEAARVEPADDEDLWVEALRHVPGVTAVYWTDEPGGLAGANVHGEWIVAYGVPGADALRELEWRLRRVGASGHILWRPVTLHPVQYRPSRTHAIRGAKT